MSTGPEKIDVRELIDRIRRALATRTPGQEQALAADLAIYSSLCDQANQRLRDCLNLMKKGQYSNAIALADEEPNLLDHCSDLDIPEVEILPMVAASLQITVPERINLSLVEALQEAYVKGNSAAGNMRLLHKLTLARAPLPARLYVMRRLMAQDTSHPYLEADIRQFETTWYKRVLDYCKPFAKDGDVEMIQMVIDDLVNSGYLETPPRQLLSTLEGLLLKARQTELPLLAQRIQQAYQNQSAEELQGLLTRWTDLARQTGIDPNDPRYELVDAMRWLKKVQDEQRKSREEDQARATLSRSIQQRTIPRVELENAYSIARAHGVVDELLESQYQSRLAEIRRRRTSVQLFAGIGSIAAIALIGIGSFWIVQSRQHQNDVSRLLSELEPLAEGGKHDEVIRKSDEAPKSVAGDQRIVTLVRASRDSITRQSALDGALTAIQDCPPDGDIDPLVEKALTLAKGESERKRVDAEHEKWKGRKGEQQQASKREFQKGIAELTAAMEKCESGNAWNAGTLTAELKGFEERVAGLREFARTKGLGEGSLPDVEKKLKLLQSRVAVASMMNEFIERQKRSTLAAPPLQEIADFLSETLAKECRNTPAEARFKLAKSDLTTWKSLQSLRERLLERSFPNASDARAWAGTPVLAVVSLSTNEAQLADSRQFPKAPPAKGTSETSQLLERLMAADMKDVTCVRAAGFAHPYFTHTPVEPGEVKIEIKSLIDFRGTTLPVKIMGQRKVFPAPQSEYLAKIEPLFSDNTRTWHAVMADAYSQLLDNQEIDPLLKLQLIDKFLVTLTSSSTSFREILESQDVAFKKVFRAAQRVSGAWYRPEEEDKLEKVRAEATELCKQAPRLTPRDAETAAKRDAMLAQTHRHSVAIIGLLSPEATDVGVTLFSGPKPERDGTLFVVAGGKWIEVGRMTGEVITLTPEAAAHIGWPVIHVCKT
jgi:hypothetical protein